MSKTKKFAFVIVIILVLFTTICYRVERGRYKIPEMLDNTLAQQYMPEKMWLHRTDSVNKQKELADKYKLGGLEFDIIFYKDSMAFENSHDKDDLSKYNLEEQFKTYKDLNYNEGIWLDFKNLNEDNKYEAKEVLDTLLRKYDISKDVVWLESSNWQSLDIFKQDGYRTSYYFPYYKFENMTEQEINDVKRKTIMIANSGNVDAVSFAGKHYYDFVSSLDLPDNIVLLTWLDDSRWYNVLLSSKQNKIVKDDRVKVILVKELGNYHR
ncbi:hypothetical protein [Megamonas hypermegale]|uniref:hypothetical protein n=1 Tax=Megamonas hypermegale TaxID=158847 RepID=UPI0026F22D35|nr:hypothetical protein [Megamonas hypermegale]